VEEEFCDVYIRQADLKAVELRVAQRTGYGEVICAGFWCDCANVVPTGLDRFQDLPTDEAELTELNFSILLVFPSRCLASNSDSGRAEGDISTFSGVF
jgi:hypothetical protein